MGNDGLPISLVVFIVVVLITAIGFVGVLAITVLNNLAATPAG